MFNRCINLAKENLYNGYEVLALLEISFEIISYTMRKIDLNTDDIIEFLHEQVLIYAVQNPPESLQVFTPKQCVEIMHYFMENFSEELINLNFFCHIPELKEEDFQEPKPIEEPPVKEEEEIRKPVKNKKKKNQRISKSK